MWRLSNSADTALSPPSKTAWQGHSQIYELFIPKHSCTGDCRFAAEFSGNRV